DTDIKLQNVFNRYNTPTNADDTSAALDLYTIPAPQRAALEGLEYNTGDAWSGPHILADLAKRDYAGAAYEIAFETNYDGLNQPGIEPRRLAQGLQILGFDVTVGPDPTKDLMLNSHDVLALGGNPNDVDVINFAKLISSSADAQSILHN